MTDRKTTAAATETKPDATERKLIENYLRTHALHTGETYDEFRITSRKDRIGGRKRLHVLLSASGMCGRSIGSLAALRKAMTGWVESRDEKQTRLAAAEAHIENAKKSIARWEGLDVTESICQTEETKQANIKVSRGLLAKAEDAAQDIRNEIEALGTGSCDRPTTPPTGQTEVMPPCEMEVAAGNATAPATPNSNGFVLTSNGSYLKADGNWTANEQDAKVYDTRRSAELAARKRGLAPGTYRALRYEGKNLRASLDAALGAALQGDNDEQNPHFIFSTTHTNLLLAAAQGLIDLEDYARQELENRNLDENGEWITSNNS